MVNKQRNNLSIFGLFSDLQEFFLNRGLSLETSDYGFRDLLNEHFHIVVKASRKKKTKTTGLISKSHIFNDYISKDIDYPTTNVNTFFLLNFYKIWITHCR